MQQGCWQGPSPSRYVMPSVPQPACSLTSTRQRLLSSASHSPLIGGAPSCSGMAVFDRHTSMGASVLVPLIEPGPLASPCSLFAPRPTGFSVAVRSPSGAARERQWLMWNALHSLLLAGDSRATLLMPTVCTHTGGRQWTLSGAVSIIESASCNNPSLRPQLNLAAARGRSSTIGLRPGFPPRFVQLSLYQLSPALVTSPVEISHHKLRDTGALPRPNLEQVTQCPCGSLRPVAQQPGELPKQVLETKILQLWRELPLQHASLKSKSLRHSEKASRHSPS
jgi:hypothetical protein